MAGEREKHCRVDVVADASAIVDCFFLSSMNKRRDGIIQGG